MLKKIINIPFWIALYGAYAVVLVVEKLRKMEPGSGE